MTLPMFRIDPPPDCGHVSAENLAAPVRAAQVDVEHALPIFVAWHPDKSLAELTPAQLTSMSTRPNCVERRRPAVLRSTRGCATSTGKNAAWPPSFSIAATRCLAALGAVAGDDHRGAGLRDALAQRAAQHAGAADDDGHLAVRGRTSCSR